MRYRQPLNMNYKNPKLKKGKLIRSLPFSFLATMIYLVIMIFLVTSV